MIHCYRCTAQLPDNTIFCTECGADLDEFETKIQWTADELDPDPAPQAKRSRALAYSVGGLVALLLFAGLVIMAAAVAYFLFLMPA